MNSQPAPYAAASSAEYHLACCRTAATCLGAAEDAAMDAIQWMRGHPEEPKTRDLLAHIRGVQQLLRDIGQAK